jgi:hypothetical protein
MKVGDKIVCVDDQFPFGVGPQGIKKDDVYTVRSYGRYSHFLDGEYYGVRLDEVDRGNDPAGYDPGDMPFRASRFKPVVSPRIEKTLEVAQ